MLSIASKRSAISGQNTIVFAVASILLILIVIPLLITAVTSARNGPLFMPGTFDFSGFKVFFGKNTISLIIDTLKFGLLSVVFAFGLSLPLTWLIERTDVPGREYFRVIIISMMAFPPAIAAVAWTLLLDSRIGAINVFLKNIFGQGIWAFNIYSLWGMAFVSGTVALPSIFLMVGPTFRRMSRELEEAGQASGASNWRILSTISIPLTRPAILVAMLYLFVVLIGTFEIPGIIGLRKGIMVFSSRLFWAVHPPIGFPEYHIASALAVGFVSVAAILMYLYVRAHSKVEKYATIVGRGSGIRLMRLGKWRWPAFSVCSAYMVVVLVLPLLILIWTSFQGYYTPPSIQAAKRLSLETYREVLTSSILPGIVVNTLKMIVISATVTTALAFFVSWVAIRSQSSLKRFINIISFLPVGMPAIVVSIAAILTYVVLPLPIYGTLWVIIIAQTTKFLAYSSSVVKASIMQLHKELEEASYASGASLLSTMKRIILPLMLPAIASSWIWVAAHSFRDLTIATTLMSRQNVVLSSYVWVLWQEGSMPQVSVIGIFMYLFLLVLTIFWQYVNIKLSTKVKLEI